MEEKFDVFFNSYNSKLKEYYLKFNSRKRKICLVYCALLLLFVFIYWIAVMNFKLIFSNYLGYLILGVIIIAILVFLAIILNLKREIYNINQFVIKDMVQYISGDSNSIYEPNKRICIENIKDMELFNLDNLKYNGNNAISTNYNGNHMNFADMEIYYYKDKIKEEKAYDKDGKEYIKKTVDKVKKYVFDGCYISATLNKKIAEHIYLIPNNFADLIINGTLKDYITYSGEEIQLENIEFSKKYKVYSDDEIQARYILSLSLMEKINEIDDILKGKKYIVFKAGRRFVICLEGFKIENLRKISLPFNYNSSKLKENLKYIFENLNKLFEIYNILELGNDIYVDKT